MSMILCEVMLNAYKDLYRACDQLDTKAERLAVGSRNADIFKMFDALINIENEKRCYCNVKVIIDEALNNIGRNTELKDHYIYGVYYKNTILRENISQQTYFYRLRKQKNLLCNAIKKKYDDDILLETLSGSRWLLNMYNKAVKQATEIENAKGNKNGRPQAQNGAGGQIKRQNKGNK